MIGSVLEPADFDEAIPYIFGEPAEYAPAVFFHSECALLPRIAQLLVSACLVADENNNLHSIGVPHRPGHGVRCACDGNSAGNS